jgi:hypothetical protein
MKAKRTGRSPFARRSHIALISSTLRTGMFLGAGTPPVRFQKKLRLVSLEMPEPGATGVPEPNATNPKFTRSRATRSTLRPKYPQSQPKKSKQGSGFVEFTENPVSRELRRIPDRLVAGCSEAPYDCRGLRHIFPSVPAMMPGLLSHLPVHKVHGSR